MKNVKGFAVATDGGMKRIAITYDVLDDTGKPINPNQKESRFVMDESVLEAISKIEKFAQTIIKSE